MIVLSVNIAAATNVFEHNIAKFLLRNIKTCFKQCCTIEFYSEHGVFVIDTLLLSYFFATQKHVSNNVVQLCFSVNTMSFCEN